MTFEQLYKLLVKGALAGELQQVSKSIEKGDKHSLDCLLSTSKQPIIWNVGGGRCDCKEHKCVSDCLFGAINIVDGKITIDAECCVGCGACIDSCKEKKLTASRDSVEVVMRLKEKKSPVYALVAPAIMGQFGDNVTMGQIRASLKKLGFSGVVEVATFADILTLREAIELSHMVEKKGDYQLTSCCCPVWISLIKKNFHQLSDHLSPSVSPMIAAGRCVKLLNASAVTVFISPCLAKKAEAREPDIAGAIDYVMTFSELKDLFDLIELDPASCDDEVKEHSSSGGRLYAKTGGVSRAVIATYQRIMEGKGIDITATQANGVPECRALLNKILEGEIDSNFYEGMGCSGGCVGGLKVVRDKAITANVVEDYAQAAKYSVPIDNPYVVKILADLGFKNVGDLLEDKDLFTRIWETK